LSSELLKLLMKSCQATFCTPLKICQKWARFIRKNKFCKFIENTLKIDYNGRNFNIVEKGECGEPVESVVRTSMTQFVFSWNTIQMQALQNVRFRESLIYLKTLEAYIRELITLLKYPDTVLVFYGRIKTSSIINYVQMLFFTLYL
jgi:hypothetical protein